jgi:uncharacterized protein YggE
MRSTFLLLSLLLFVTTMASFPALSRDNSQINVQGVGAVSVVPNAYSVTFVVEHHGATVSKLNTALQSDLHNVVSFLLEQGLAENDIQSMQVRLSPRYINSPEGRKQKGFTLSREIVITDKNIDNYDRVLDGVLKRGVERIQQFSFINISNTDSYEQALIVAVKNAKQRAHILAKELGVEIGEVVAISESGGNMPIPVMRAEAFSKDMSMSLPGTETVEARVNVSFNIKQ